VRSTRPSFGLSQIKCAGNSSGLLQATLDEEGNTDKILTEIAEELVPEALESASAD
jgi:hypothetical protein